MKTAGKLKKYFKKRTTRINALIKKPTRILTPEYFHQLRIEIKKLKAFFEMINDCNKSFKHNNMFKPFKIIFKQAGKVRELQLEEAAVKKYASLHGYKDNLKIYLVKERNDFISMADKKYIKQLNKMYPEIIPFLRKTKMHCIDDYLEKKRQRINLLFKSKNLKESSIHELRKRLKEFYYIEKLVKNKTESKNLKKIDAFQELLGHWHDGMVMKDHLQKAIGRNNLKPGETRLLERLKKIIVSESKIKLRKINTKKKELQIF